MSTAEAIRSLRSKLKMSQSAFAAHVGLTVDTISRYERGRKEPASKVLIRLSKVATEIGESSLRELFLAQRRCKVVRRVAHLSGKKYCPGIARPVAALDVEQASDALRFLSSEAGEQAAKTAIDGLIHPETVESDEHLKQLAEFLRFYISANTKCARDAWELLAPYRNPEWKPDASALAGYQQLKQIEALMTSGSKPGKRKPSHNQAA